VPPTALQCVAVCCGVLVYSCEKLVYFCVNSRENLFEMYGDTRELFFVIWEVVMFSSPISFVRGLQCVAVCCKGLHMAVGSCRVLEGFRGGLVDVLR